MQALTMNNAMFQENFIIEDLMYIPMGRHHPMLTRPYMITASHEAIQTIADRYHGTQSSKITGNMINDISTQMIQPSAVGIETLVNNDWVNTGRYLFIMKVSWIDAYGTHMMSYLQGFTEYDGIGQNGSIDFNMTHYVNAIIETIRMDIPTPMGVHRQEKLHKFYNVIGSKSSVGGNYMFTQRPIDVIENIDLLNSRNMIEQGGGNNYQYYNMNNFMSGMENKIVGSQVDNAVPTKYLAKILNTGVLSNKNRDMFASSYSVTDNSGVEGKIPEPSLNDNRFMKFLSNVMGSRSVLNVFNFAALNGYDQTLYNRFKIINLNKDMGLHPSLAQTPELGDYWNGSDPVTLKAYSLLESAVATATRHGFSKMIFTASNMINPMGTCEMMIMSYGTLLSIQDSDQVFLMEMFKSAFEIDVFMSESMASKVPLHAEFYIDLMGTSKVFLQYAGYPGNWYTAPTGANSFFNPVVTYDQNALDYSTQAVMNVIDTVTSEMKPTPTFY